MALLLSVSVISAATLGLEVLLLRLFSIVLWHHFAFLAISLALLGFGASGTFLTVARGLVERRFAATYLASAALFAVAAPTGFLAAQHIPFNAFEVAWHPGQWANFFAIYVVLAIPFFASANCIGLALTQFPERIHHIYRADLLGAGLGALGIVIALFQVRPTTGLLWVGAGGLAAAAIAVLDPSVPVARRWSLAPAVAALLMPLLWPASWSTLTLSPYKGLSTALQTKGAHLAGEYSSPMGLLSVVESSDIPLRHAPGLSLVTHHAPPPQLALFTDGDALEAITAGTADPARLAYLDDLITALPFRLRKAPRVMVIGIDAGQPILAARYHGAAHIDATALNPQRVWLLRVPYGRYTGHVLDGDDVTVAIGEGRAFLARGDRRYDLIELSLPGAAGVGADALRETYAVTVQALGEYLNHLGAGGLLAVSGTLELPPRASLKLIATAITALMERGVAHPADHLIVARSWSTVLIVVKTTPFSAQEIAATGTFCDERGFDLAHVPGITPEQANRYNRLARPFLYQGTEALLGSARREFLDDYKFDLTPATDERPYFLHFFKWSSLPELMHLQSGAGLAQMEWGYIILVASLLQSVAASVFLILVPLWASRRHPLPRRGRWPVVGYFAALGLAFLFVEIAFIQRLTLFLGHPLYATTVVLCVFLVFAGLGSGLSRKVAEALGGKRAAIALAVAALATLAIVYLLWLPATLHHFMGSAVPIKVLLSAALAAPLALWMGMPFPLGLQHLATRDPRFIPWAWAVNGCASVVSAVLAMLLSIHFGFSAVVMIALALYAAAAITVRCA